MDPATTVDEVCRGALRLEQPRRGYRFNIDAVLLARFAVERALRAPDQLVDLGAGCGVVGLLAAQAWPASQVTLVEIQPDLAALCRLNAERNGLAARARVIEGDLREPGAWATPPGGQRLVLCNPPFHARGSGHVSARETLAVARHEVLCAMDELVRACAAGLDRGGELALIHVAARGGELLDLLAATGFGSRVVRPVLPLPGRGPTRVLVHAVRGAARDAAARELPPLIVNDGVARYSAEVRRMLNEAD